MPNSTASIQTLDFQQIFPKTNLWYDEMMHHYHEINKCKTLLDQSTTDKEYMENWDAWNQAYHWWLIRMDQYLNFYGDKCHEQIHDIVYAAFTLGQRTGYWNNKHSRLLYNLFQNHHSKVIS